MSCTSPAAFFPRHRDRAEGEKRAEAVLQADHWHQVSLGGADHPDGRLLGRGPCREARLRPHQDLCGQTQQVRLCPCVFFSRPVGEATFFAPDIQVFADATANCVQLAIARRAGEATRASEQGKQWFETTLTVARLFVHSRQQLRGGRALVNVKGSEVRMGRAPGDDHRQKKKWQTCSHSVLYISVYILV